MNPATQKATHPRIAGRIFHQPLMIYPPKLQVIVNGISPRIGIDGWEDDQNSPAEPGRPPNGSSIANGIAVIDVYGSLVKRCSGMDAESGLTSYQDIQNELNAAAADARVTAILLDVDSYGGECAGAFDLSDLIYAIRQKIPVYAIANSFALSAGFAIASAAEKVFVNQDGLVGSVGVIAIHCDQSGYDEKTGLKYTAITFGAHKNDATPYAPLTDQAATELQADVDRLGELFVAKVARNRGMSVEAVRETQAKIYSGAEAIQVGFADQIGTIDDAMAAINLKLGTKRVLSNPRTFTASASAAAIQPKEVTHVTENTETRADAGTGTPPDAEAIRREVSASALADFKKNKLGIENLCRLNPKFVNRAAGFIAEGLTVEQVQEKLLAERVTEAGTEELATAVMPVTGAETKPNSGSLVAACKKLAQNMIQKARS